VRYVIDSGRAKFKHFHNGLGLDSLLVKTISKSSAIQRTGRAGREGPGKCWRMYTEATYLSMQQQTTPEFLRCDLSSAILTMKARGIDDVVTFPLLDRPSRQALEKALLHLMNLGALDSAGTISSIGSQMARLPLTPSLSRVLIAASKVDHGPILEIIDIIAALSVENVFLNPTTEEAREKAIEARHDLTRRQGDHLTLLAAVRGFAGEPSDRKSWAERRWISHRGMRQVMEVRKQLRSQCVQQKLLHKSQLADADSPAISDELVERILRCFLRGFGANTARLMPDGSYKTFVGNHAVAIHPSSVLFGRKVEGIVFNEFVFTNKSYARGVSAVQTNWIGDAVEAMGEE
jgi:ATP-dependent RNA helicase DHR2